MPYLCPPRSPGVCKARADTSQRPAPAGQGPPAHPGAWELSPTWGVATDPAGECSVSPELGTGPSPQ